MQVGGYDYASCGKDGVKTEVYDVEPIPHALNEPKALLGIALELWQRRAC